MHRIGCKGRRARHQPLRRSSSRGHASRRPRVRIHKCTQWAALSPRSKAGGNKPRGETQVRRLRTAGRCCLLTASSSYISSTSSCESDHKIIYHISSDGLFILARGPLSARNSCTSLTAHSSFKITTGCSALFGQKTLSPHAPSFLWQPEADVRNLPIH